jgi:hypothetical protein
LSEIFGFEVLMFELKSHVARLEICMQSLEIVDFICHICMSIEVALIRFSFSLRVDAKNK